MKIYIDVSNLMHVNFISGIQRVVREVVLRMLQETDMQVVLVAFDDVTRKLYVLSNTAFFEYFQNGKGKKEDIWPDEKDKAVQRIEDFQPGSIWFEIDSAWHSKWNRMELYPLLKGRGVRIAVCFQDIIPVMWPQYVDRVTTAVFTGYITACMTHADLFISSTNANIAYLKALMKQVGIEREVPGYVSWLGVDFKANAGGKIRKSVQDALAEKKYILMVGTIEPRKNQKLILDAFDKALFEKGFSLVIAGRVGWNVKELEQRIRKHPHLGKKLIFIEDASDAEIEYLYQNSFLVAFPSFTEGFGLPITEALGRGIPVIASDHPVMREVGGDWCEYVSPYHADEFISCVMKYEEDAQLYQSRKQKLMEYTPCSWDTVEKNIVKALETMRYEEGTVNAAIRQMVILSARAEDFLKSLPFVEHFMPFIEEIVLCCPDSMKAEVEAAYAGRLKMQYLTDSEVIGEDELPKDHSPRNIFLRAKAIRHAIIDDVFLMGDDDYRPLCRIDQEVFLSNGKYHAYYSHDLLKWHGTQGNLTSFDRAQKRNRDFLCKRGYPTYMFDSHMPQAIDKKKFIEMVDRYPELVEEGITEWNYFNYLAGEYPGMVTVQPYKALGWPGHLEDWDTEVSCKDFLFENYYEDVYEEKDAYGNPGRFYGFSKEYKEGIEKENQKKKEIMGREYLAHKKAQEKFEEWQADYRNQWRMNPVFAVYTKEKEVCMCVPDDWQMQKGSFLRVEFSVLLDQEAVPEEEWQMTFGFYEGDKLVSAMGSSRFMTKERLFDVLVVAPKQTGTYRLEWNLFTGKTRVHQTTQLVVKD